MNRFVLTLFRRSLVDRRFSLSLIVLALATSVALYVSVQNIQRMTRAGFESTISNVDLVVAARGSDVQILLNAVFGIGASTSLMSAESVAALGAFKQTAWRAPVSLGDSHKGYRVIGTNNAMFEHVLANSNGDIRFPKVLSAVVGADVAMTLGYAEGDALVLQHGVAEYGAAHDDLPFTVAAVLAPTGTPFDRVIFVPLQASEAIHRGWRGGQRLLALKPEQVDETLAGHDEHHDGHHDGNHDEHHDAHDDHDEEHHDEQHDEHDEHGHGPGGIDAVFVGLRDRRTIVQMQRRIAEYDGENLMAVIPGVTLAQIWQVISMADRGFVAINLLIIGLVLISMVALTVLSADNRRREMAILRALGAAPRTLVGLMMAEAFLLASAAVVLGVGMSFILSSIAQGWLATRFGLAADVGFQFSDGLMALYLIPAALLANLVPTIRLYRNSVNDGIMVKR